MQVPLPIIDGVGPSCHRLPPGSWTTIFDFLRERFPQIKAETWLTRMKRGQLVDESGRRLDALSAYRVGGFLFYYRELELETTIPFAEEILYEDEHILVVDKPHFLPVIPAGRFLHETLLVRLRKQGKPEALVPVHRLDRETAGVIIFSVNEKTRGLYTSLFQNRRVTKVYEAIAPSAQLGFPLTRHSRIVEGEPFFRMKEVAGEPNAETRIEVIEEGYESSLYRLCPVTGRKHQLRIHLAALGIPIVNDRLYPELSSTAESNREDDFSSPLKLLARSISFSDPLTGDERYFESSRSLDER